VNRGVFGCRGVRHKWRGQRAKTCCRVARVFGVAALVSGLPGLAGQIARADDGAEPHGFYLSHASDYITAKDAYDQLVMQPEANYLRGGLELALMLGAGTAWYWIDRERNLADWDFPSFKQRLNGDALALDSNEFGINYLFHPLAGMGYHAALRSNGLSLAGSVVGAFAASFVWEFGLEFREKLSLNDFIVTTGAGTASGEFMHWLGVYLNSGPGGQTAWGKAARWILGFPETLHAKIDDRQRPFTGDLDALGLSQDIAHDFRFSYAFLHAQAEATLEDSSPWAHHVGLSAALVALPGYQRQGRFDQFFASGNFSDLGFVLTHSSEGTGYDLDTGTTLLGYYAQAVAPGRWSRSLMIGTRISFRAAVQRYAGWRDRFALMQLPGAAVDGRLQKGRLWFRFAGTLHPTFGSADAPAFEIWRAQNPGVKSKSILEKQGYFYGFGWSTDAQLEAGWGPLGLFGSYRRWALDSIEGLDRNQDAVQVDWAVDRWHSTATVGASYTTGGCRAHLVVSLLRSPGLSSSVSIRSPLRLLGLRLVCVFDK